MPNYIAAGISNGIPSAILKQISGGLLKKTPVRISEGISEKLTEEPTEKKIFVGIFQIIFKEVPALRRNLKYSL